jgi:ribosomal protein S30
MVDDGGYRHTQYAVAAEASPRRDEKSRNAYKRAWRNRRNYERRIENAANELKLARRSYELYEAACRELV